MDKQDRLVIELIVMSQVKYLRDIALATTNDAIIRHDINAVWEEQKKHLAATFKMWDS